MVYSKRARNSRQVLLESFRFDHDHEPKQSRGHTNYFINKISVTAVSALAISSSPRAHLTMFGSVCCRFSAIATGGHAAPAPRVSFGAVVEYECAGRSLAFSDQTEIRRADKISDRLCNRLQKALRSGPSAFLTPVNCTRRALIIARPDLLRGSDLAIDLVTR